jgi:toxin YoeB
LEFDIAAFEDLAWWIQQDRSKALRIVNLVRDVQREPFQRNWQARTAEA